MKRLGSLVMIANKGSTFYCENEKAESYVRRGLSSLSETLLWLTTEEKTSPDHCVVKPKEVRSITSL